MRFALHTSSPLRRLHSHIPVFHLLVAVLLSGCASTGATLNSGVGDTFHEHAPYYAGAAVSANAEITGHFPVVYQRGASQAATFDPSLTQPMRDLLTQMNGYLESLNVSKRLIDGSVSALSSTGSRTPPDVRFGCVTTGHVDGDCDISGDTTLGRKNMRLKLAVGRPAREWIQWSQQVMTERGAEQALIITLEVGQYLVQQRGIVGKKQIELGTGFMQELPWLTSLETPVSVLQLTGVLVGKDGKAIRIGAEGMLAHRTSLLASAVGAQALISDDDVKKLLNARRDDLPGKPLVWQVSMRNLVSQLTAQPIS
jgi:hypothetical protein